MKNYIVANVDEENNKILVIDTSEENIKNFSTLSLKKEELCTGWTNCSLNFKYNQNAPTIKEVFTYIENVGKTEDLQDIRVYNTNRNYITDREMLKWDSWESLRDHPLYKNDRKKIERFSYVCCKIKLPKVAK